jgi:hypothetical protein
MRHIFIKNTKKFPCTIYMAVDIEISLQIMRIFQKFIKNTPKNHQKTQVFRRNPSKFQKIPKNGKKSSKSPCFQAFHVGKPEAWTLFGLRILKSCQFRALHGRADRAADQAVQPVVVRPGRPLFPFVNRPRERHCSDTVFGGQMFR